MFAEVEAPGILAIGVGGQERRSGADFVRH